MGKRKDPAFLFYPGDWSGGTMTMTRHLKGCYIDLLVAQFNQGPLSLEEIRTVLGNDFASWGTLSKKFAQNAAGKFCNERLEAEKEKRATFCKVQGNRRKGKLKKPYASGEVSGEAPKIEYENKNVNRFFLKGNETDFEVFAESIHRLHKIPPEQLDPYLEEFDDWLISTEETHRTLKSYKYHFGSWLRKKLESKKNGNTVSKSEKTIHAYGQFGQGR